MQKKVVTLFLIISILSGCRSLGGVIGDGDGGGGNDSNPDALVGTLLFIGAGLLWKNRDSIFKKDTGSKSEASIPNNIKSTNYRYVYDHTYTPVVSLGNEKKGYGLYTYVLLNKKIATEGTALEDYRKKAKIVLEIIQSYQPSTNMSYIDLAKINNFIIPATNKESNTVTLENYSFSLSNKVTNTISSTLLMYNNGEMAKTFRKNEGPFLVTTLKPITQTGDVLYLLYVDMSSLKPSATHEVMDTYVNKLENSESGNMPFSRLETIRLNALKHLVGFNNVIAVVKQSIPGG